MNQDFQKAFSKVDFIATPVTTTLPFLIGEKNLDPLKMYLLDLIKKSFFYLQYFLILDKAKQ